MLELPQRFFDIFIARTAQEIAALEIRLVRLGVHSADGGEARLLLRRQLHIDLVRDRRRQLVLQGEYIPRRTLKAFRPEVFVGRRIDQLRSYPHPVTSSKD